MSWIFIQVSYHFLCAEFQYWKIREAANTTSRFIIKSVKGNNTYYVFHRSGKSQKKKSEEEKMENDRR